MTLVRVLRHQENIGRKVFLCAFVPISPYVTCSILKALLHERRIGEERLEEGRLVVEKTHST
jgi:hypothetical protein